MKVLMPFDFILTVCDVATPVHPRYLKRVTRFAISSPLHRGGVA